MKRTVDEPPPGDTLPPPAGRGRGGSRRGALLVLSGSNAGSIVALDREVLVGRDPDCDVRFDDLHVSRRHARILLQPNGFLLEDCGSKSGTRVGGVRVRRDELQDGDRITLGESALLRFLLLDEDEARQLSSIYESGMRDALTGLFNRRQFELSAREEIAYARRHHAPLGLLMIDIDHFKRINDGHGHAAGDKALRKVARALGASIRTEDVLARYGGEEFVVLARGTDLAGATVLAERLRREVAAGELDHRGAKLPMTISVGVSSLACIAPADTVEALVAAADRRLYFAKAAGRDRTVAAG